MTGRERKLGNTTKWRVDFQKNLKIFQHLLENNESYQILSAKYGNSSRETWVLPTEMST
jgi:hypothetical protein